MENNIQKQLIEQLEAIISEADELLQSVVAMAEPQVEDFVLIGDSADRLKRRVLVVKNRAEAGKCLVSNFSRGAKKEKIKYDVKRDSHRS